MSRRFFLARRARRPPSAWRSLGAVAALTLAAANPARAASPPAEEPHFPVTRFEVEGARVLPKAEVDRVLAPFVGPDRDFAILEEAVAALKRAYAAAGYSSVSIVLPEQEVQNGVIRLQVTEARVGRVTVTGNKFFDNDNVTRSLPALNPGAVPNMEDLAAQVRMANDNPSKQVQVTMRQGKAADETDALVRVADQDPLQFAVVADNTGTAETGRFRVGLAVHEANVFNLDHVLSAEFQTAPDRVSKVDIIGLNYLIPLYGLGQTVDFSAGYSNVNSGLVTTTAGSYGITGGGTTLGARLTQYLARSETLTQRLFEGLSWRAYTNDVQLAGQGQSLVPDVTVHPVDLGYELSYNRDQVAIDAGLTYSHNIPGGSHGSDADFQAPGGRQDATASYQLIRYQANLLATLKYGWLLHADLNGQLTNDALVAPEQFGAGGVDSVRGFEEREAIDDRGVRYSVELQTPDQASAWLGPDWQLRWVVFYDGAALERNHVLPDEIAHLSLASTGLGLRLVYNNRATLRLDWAEVLHGAGIRPDHSNMLHASAIVTF